MISARMEMAISVGVLAPISRPAGARSRASYVSDTPSAASLSRMALLLARLEINAT
jgi:hypothetical protein